MSFISKLFGNDKKKKSFPGVNLCERDSGRDYDGIVKKRFPSEAAERFRNVKVSKSGLMSRLHTWNLRRKIRSEGRRIKRESDERVKLSREIGQMVYRTRHAKIRGDYAAAKARQHMFERNLRFQEKRLVRSGGGSLGMKVRHGLSSSIFGDGGDGKKRYGKKRYSRKSYRRKSYGKRSYGGTGSYRGKSRRRSYSGW